MNTQKPLKETLEQQYPWCVQWEADLTKLYRTYVERKQRCNILDYDDLLLYWHAMMADARLAEHVSGALRSHPRRRVPGHEPAAGGHPARAAAGWRGAHRGGRRRAGDLLVPRRRGRQHPRLPGSLHAARRSGDAGAELPLDPAGAGCVERADGGSAAAVSQAPAVDSRVRACGRAWSP